MAIQRGTDEVHEKQNVEARDAQHTANLQEQEKKHSREREQRMQLPHVNVEGHAPAGLQTIRQQWGKRRSEENCAIPSREEKVRKPTYISQRELKLQCEKQGGKQGNRLWSRCPRCNSTDTKFCYFNNYNINQPRHFCKHCQRYWTAGGTLRNVPIGAGKRKNKQILQKEAFPSPLSCMMGSSTFSDASVMDSKEAVHASKTDSVNANVSVKLPTEVGTIQDPGCGNGKTVIGVHAVDTKLALSAHPSDPVQVISSCIQPQLSIFSGSTPLQHPHTSYLSTFQQLQAALPTISTPSCPSLANKGTKIIQTLSDSPCNRTGNILNLTHFTPPIAVESSTPNLVLHDAGETKQDPSNSAKFRQISPKSEGEQPKPVEAAHLHAGLPPLSISSAISLKASSSVPQTDSPGLKKVDSMSDEKQNLAEPANTNSTPNHGVPDAEASVPRPGAKGPGGFESGLPSFWGPQLWPYLYTCWLNNVAPRGFSHVSPILTPRGWALPFVPSTLNNISYATQPILNLGSPQSPYMSLFCPPGAISTFPIAPQIITSTTLNTSNDKPDSERPSTASMASQAKASTHTSDHEHHDGRKSNSSKSES
ncbi:hypothetical protein KP509_24G054400 [Ceratopteris richardii]|nr:hypothetical protein KP509_24G054400 [Ceratopteris richardii]